MDRETIKGNQVADSMSVSETEEIPSAGPTTSGEPETDKQTTGAQKSAPPPAGPPRTGSKPAWPSPWMPIPDTDYEGEGDDLSQIPNVPPLDEGEKLITKISSTFKTKNCFHSHQMRTVAMSTNERLVVSTSATLRQFCLVIPTRRYDSGSTIQVYWHEVMGIEKKFGIHTAHCCLGLSPEFCDYVDEHSIFEIEVRPFRDPASKPSTASGLAAACLRCLPRMLSGVGPNGGQVKAFAMNRDDAAKLMTVVHKGMKPFVTMQPLPPEQMTMGL